MKKLISISVLMLIVTAFSFFELWYDYNNFSELTTELNTLSTTIEKNVDSVNVGEVKDAFEKVMYKWNEMSRVSMTITNHNVIRMLNEKFIYLKGFIEADVYSDASSTAKVLIEVCEGLKHEKYPILGNVF